MAFLTRESVVVDSANRNNQDLLLMALTGAYGSYTQEEVDNALIRAAINGNTRCVSLLLDWNADCDAEDMDGDTPLMLAACNNHIDVVQLLINAGCGVNRVSDRHRTALHMAAWVGNIKVCQMLLQAGADPSIQEMYGDTALMLAAHRSPDVACLLVNQKQAINIRNDNGDTALSCAAKAGHCESVRVIVEAGGDINARNRNGETALVYATYENHIATVQFLLRSGADPNIATNSGLTPVHIACQKKMEEMCGILLESGADPDVSDKSGQRPLTLAVSSGKASTVLKLIQAGACPKYQGPALFNKRTVVVSPLYKALLDKRLDIAEMLLRAGSSRSSELFQIYKCEELQSELEDTARGLEVLSYIRKIACNPHSLRLMCFQVVHSVVGRKRGWQDKIRSLQLPKPLVAFLLFGDLVDC